MFVPAHPLGFQITSSSIESPEEEAEQLERTLTLNAELVEANRRLKRQIQKWSLSNSVEQLRKKLKETESHKDNAYAATAHAEFLMQNMSDDRTRQRRARRRLPRSSSFSLRPGASGQP